MLAAAGLLTVVLGGLLVPLASSTGHHTFDEFRTEETTAGSVLAAQVSDAVARAAAATAEPQHPGPALASATSAAVRANRLARVDR
jgi:D-aminopeptidase